jgi:hypothetical protein
MSGITDSAKFNSNSSYYLANEPSTAGNTDTINGNLTVTGNINSVGSISSGTTLAVQGATTIGGSLNVTGAVTMASTLNATGLVTATAGVTSNAVVTAPSFVNSSATGFIVIPLVLAGIPQENVTTGPTGTGNNMMVLPMSLLVPGSQNFKSYRVHLSSSATNPYVGWALLSGGGGSGEGALLTQLQATSGYQAYSNILGGNIAIAGTSVPAGGGSIAGFPVNAIITPQSLTNNTIYYCGVSTNGTTIGVNGTVGSPAITQIYLHFFPIL